jgi:outer membrane autotransporter protein
MKNFQNIFMAQHAGILNLKILSSVLVSLTSPVFADNECGEASSGIVTCNTGGSYSGVRPDGAAIFYQTSNTTGTPVELIFDNAEILVDGGVTIYNFTNEGGEYGATLTLNDFSEISGKVYAVSTQNEGFANVILEQGEISNTDTANESHGISAQSHGAATVEMRGGSVTTYGNSSRGLLAGIDGSATALMSAGSITTNGSSYGIEVRSRANTGITLATMDNGIINSAGGGMYSLIDNNENTETATAIMNGGEISATDNGAGAIRVASTGTGSALAQLNNGTISSHSGLYSDVIGTTGSGTATSIMTGGNLTVSGRRGFGLFSRYLGPGSANATVSGNAVITVSGSAGQGLIVKNQEASSSYAVSIEDEASVTILTGGGFGVETQSAAGTTGTININASATVDAAAGNGAINDGPGNTTVTTSGNVKGRTILGSGNDVFNLSGGDYAGNVYGNEGDDFFNWSAGDLSVGFIGQSHSGFYGGDGADTAVITAEASYQGTEILDGGGDSGDALTLQGHTVSASGYDIRSWGSVTLNETTLTLNNEEWRVSALNAPSTPGSGVFVTNGSNLNAMDVLRFTGNLLVDENSAFVATGRGEGIYTVSGSVRNDGTVTTQDGAAGDMTTISENYSGIGRLLLDVDTSTDRSDKVFIEGTVDTGSNILSIVNVSPTLASGNTLEIVGVSGNQQDTAFILERGPIVAGIYDYDLMQTQSGFVLKALLNSTGAAYTASAGGGTISTETMQQRTSSRHTAMPVDGGRAKLLLSTPEESASLWFNVLRSRTESTDGSGGLTQGNSSGLVLGLDMAPLDVADGQLTFGIMGSYNVESIDNTIDLGTGSVRTEEISLGLSLLHENYGGGYVLGQLAFGRNSSDFSSSNEGELASGVTSSELLGSIEIGQKFDFDPNNSIMLNTQLEVGSSHSGSFIDILGNSIDFGTTESSSFSIGLAYEHKFENMGPVNDGNIVLSLSRIAERNHNNTMNLAGSTIFIDSNTDWLELGLESKFNFSDENYYTLAARYSTQIKREFGSSEAFSFEIGYNF